MENVKYILGFPEHVEGVGDLYPVKVKEYNVYSACSSILTYGLKHFQAADERIKLLDCIVFGFEDQAMVPVLEKLFSLVLHKPVSYVSNEEVYGFVIDEEHVIHRGNYDEVRSIVMKQNLLFEPKVYKNALVQEWANKVLAARAKNGVKIGFEDMMTTVKVFCGITYTELAEQTLYQLTADFKRIIKLKSYDTQIAFACVSGKADIEFFAEQIDLFEDPYKDIFKSSENMNITKAIGS